MVGCIRVVLTKSEAVSWYRIYEMFQFQSFHMYGIIMTAIGTGIIGIQLIKEKNQRHQGLAIEIQIRARIDDIGLVDYFLDLDGRLWVLAQVRYLYY
jgi:hypothetical protein